MTFEDYYQSRKHDESFTYQTTKEQTRIYYKAISSGCLSCGLTDVVKLNAFDEGKIYCSSCTELGLHDGKQTNNKKEPKKNNKPIKKIDTKSKLKPELNLLESAKVAKHSVSKFPLDELLEIVDFLEGPKEIQHTVKLLNEKIAGEYRNNILSTYAEKNIKENSESIELDLKESMALGLRSIFKLEKIVELMGKGEVKARSISKTHTWKDLKDEF